MQAKAAVLRGSGTPLEVQTVTVDDPGPGQVRVKLSACGLCHTDLSVLQSVLPRSAPLVLGHEGAGVVESVGADVTSVAPGDHVILTTTAFCGRCFQCVEGMYAQCERMPLTMGGNFPFHLDGIDLMPFASVGGLCEYTVVAENTAIKIDDDIPLVSASLLGCGVITGVGAAINTAEVRPGATCAIWGCGGVGLSVLQGCLIAGASMAISIDTNPAKLEFAKKLGATHVVDASQDNPVEQVMALTGGRGADYTFEAIGVGSAMEQTYMAARRGGTATIVGVGRFEDTFSLSAGLFAITEKTLKGSFCGKGASVRDFPRMIEWYRAGKLDLDSLVTTTYPIEDVAQAYEDMVAGKNARGVVVF